MSRLDCILIYERAAWQGFLISHLAADYCRVEAGYEDEGATLERFLTPNIRAVLFQVNLSYSGLYPARRREIVQVLRERHIEVLNQEVDDISKRNLHALLRRAGLRSARADERGPADQRLFIKSDLNWGGEHEKRLPEALRRRFLPQPVCAIDRWNGYYVERRGDIDPALWSDRSVVIERHIENAEGSFYRVYGFGDAVVVVKAYSPFLVKKIIGTSGDTNLLLGREQILRARTELDADLQALVSGFMRHYPLAYFCLDIVHDGETHYIIDLNLTPYAGVGQQSPEIVEFLCQGAVRRLERGPGGDR